MGIASSFLLAMTITVEQKDWNVKRDPLLLACGAFDNCWGLLRRCAPRNDDELRQAAMGNPQIKKNIGEALK